MSAHTPGPWTTGSPYGMHGVEVVGDHGNRKVCGVIGVDRDQYDKGGRKLAAVPDAEGWANAHLIAAAPDLLEALEDALQYLQHHLPEEVLVAHRAAIAKAKGDAVRPALALESPHELVHYQSGMGREVVMVRLTSNAATPYATYELAGSDEHGHWRCVRGEYLETEMQAIESFERRTGTNLEAS